jgi:site-specific DNA recombinase
MSKAAAIYVRVSTDDQAERGYSLPSQIEACQKFASQKGLDVAAVYQDDISGAKPIGGRPEGGQLQAAIYAGQIKTVIVFCVDRLSRDIVDLLTVVRDWLQLGVEIYALDMGQVKSELDVVFVIKAWQGGDERQKIIERTTRGKREKAKAGKVVGTGQAPYGYDYKDGELFINDSQARIVRMIFDWYINGDENSNMMNLIGIARRLTEMGIPTPSESRGLYGKRTRRGSWVHVSVHYIIKSETYCGVFRYGKEKGHHGGMRPKDEHVLVSVPPIVTRETWERAQARRSYNSKIARRRMKREYLLRGLILCGCGRVMVGTHEKYCCTRRYNPTGNKEPCTEPLVRGAIIEPVTWNYIMKLVKDPQQFEEKLRQAQAKEGVTMQPKQKELEHVIALLEETEREAEVIARETLKAKGIIAAKLEHQGEEVNRRYEALSARKIELQETLTLELTDQTINNLLQFRETVALGLENPTFEDKRLWLELLQASVTVENQKAVIRCRISSKPFTFDLKGGGVPIEFRVFPTD